LQQFLEEHIPDTDAAHIGIIEWRPSQAVYGGEYLRLFSETAEFVKRVDANKKTVRNFGRRWFRNVIKNVTMIRKVPRMPAWKGPLVITGAGPSLEETIPLIRKRRRGLFVLAAASSAPALRAGGVTPDMVLSTDGGGWALPHLYEALRRKSPAPVTFAASLWAALPSQLEALPWLPLSDGSLWQSLLLKTVGCPVLSLPQRGTVSAAALDLAFALSGGPVYIAGMDLANHDLRTHARPYAFDWITEGAASRLSPAYSAAYIRAAAQGETLGSRASKRPASNLGVYADWFRRKLDSYPGRLFSLGGNNPVFASRQAEDFMAGGEQEEARFEIVEFPGEFPAEKGAAALAETLIRGLDAAETGEVLAGELGPLLLNDVTITVTALKTEIARICGVSHG
jgi:hypothetical protein